VTSLSLFVRGGSIFPMGPLLQYSNEKLTDPIELRIYRGAEVQFTLYENEENACGYEKEQEEAIPLHWDDSICTLEMKIRTGSFPGMLKEHTFKVVVVSKDHGAWGNLAIHFASVVSLVLFTLNGWCRCFGQTKAVSSATFGQISSQRRSIG